MEQYSKLLNKTISSFETLNEKYTNYLTANATYGIGKERLLVRLR